MRKVKTVQTLHRYNIKVFKLILSLIDHRISEVEAIHDIICSFVQEPFKLNYQFHGVGICMAVGGFYYFYVPSPISKGVIWNIVKDVGSDFYRYNCSFFVGMDEEAVNCANKYGWRLNDFVTVPHLNHLWFYRNSKNSSKKYFANLKRHLKYRLCDNPFTKIPDSHYAT